MHMKTLANCLESILSDETDVGLSDAIAGAKDKWCIPIRCNPHFNVVGDDTLEIVSETSGVLTIFDLDYLYSVGIKNVKIADIGVVRIENVSAIKDMSIEVMAARNSKMLTDTHLRFYDCPSLTMENVSLKAGKIKISPRNYKSFVCSLSKVNIECSYLSFDCMTKLDMHRSNIHARCISIYNISGSFGKKLSKLNIGQFADKQNLQPWPTAFKNFPSPEKEIELLDVDVENLLGIKNNKLDTVGRIVLSQDMEWGLIFFKRSLRSTPLSYTSRCAQCDGPFEVSITKEVRIEIPWNYRLT